MLKILNELVDSGRIKTDFSKEFQRWFGNSKVVDEFGNPLKVYHGTTNGGFKEFKDQEEYKNETSGLGFWFTNDRDVAGSFSKDVEYFFNTKIKDEYTEKSFIYPVYLSLQNPKIYRQSEENKELILKIKDLDNIIARIRKYTDNSWSFPNYEKLKLLYDEFFPDDPLLHSKNSMIKVLYGKEKDVDAQLYLNYFKGFVQDLE
ncbi:MAG: hypothetical protein QXG00_08470, partial [Candidatus Woesearchaeota archaeon]